MFVVSRSLWSSLLVGTIGAHEKEGEVIESLHSLKWMLCEEVRLWSIV